MAKSKSAVIGLLNAEFEILWSIVNAPDSELSPEEKADLNACLEKLLVHIKNVGPLPN